MSFRKPLAERLWNRLKIDDPAGCWEWTGHKLRGYGQIGLGGRQHGLAYTHVLAWIIDNGQEPPPGMLVCHKCDNPACCNPDHLFLGTPKDNTQDMIAKGRHSHGERQSKKLKEADVRQIRHLVGGGMKHAVVADKFGVSRSMIGVIANGKRWAHV